MTYFLYGPSGSGKSTIGRLFAAALDLPFLDLDTEIETRAGMTIPQIFAGEGEPAFRAREGQVLAELLTGSNKVIALGGGALLDERVRCEVEKHGVVIRLMAAPEILAQRLYQDVSERPLLNGGVQARKFEELAGRLNNLLAQRADHYASFDLGLDTSSLSPEQASGMIQVMIGRFRVSGMGAAYDVLVRPGCLLNSPPENSDPIGELLRQRGLPGPVAVISDTHVAAIYTASLEQSLSAAGYSVRCIAIQPGEAYKNITTVNRLWEEFLDAGLERNSTVVALGGGVVSDLAGFAAATYLRGVPWVVIPTTLLAMCDASMGGKTGVDLPRGKNLVGAFHSPRLVLADPGTLATLPEVELRNGLAEVVKHGIIHDPALFDLCSRDWEALKANWTEVVKRAMAVKIRVIQEDPYERGWRAALNLGHTIGHALELVSNFTLRHGEAVAIGMVVEARLAEKIQLAEPGLADTIATTLHNLGLPVEIPAQMDRAQILQAMKVDKKRADGKIRFALPTRVGEVKVGIALDEATLLAEVN